MTAPSLTVAASAASTSRTPRRLPLTSVIERAQRLDASGVKRAAELDSSEFRDSQASAFEQAPPVEEPSQAADALVVSKEDIFASLGDPSVHPLVHIYHGGLLGPHTSFGKPRGMIMALGMADGIYPPDRSGRLAAALDFRGRLGVMMLKTAMKHVPFKLLAKNTIGRA